MIEGTPFNNSCLIASRKDGILVTEVCVTRNVSAKFEDLVNSDGTCALCYYNEDECHQLNSNITTINVVRYEERKSYCSPYQHTMFWSDSASLKDNGTKIWCGYDNNSPTGYTFFIVTVQPRLYEASSPILLSGLVVVIVIAIIVNAIIGIRLYQRRKLHTTGQPWQISNKLTSGSYVCHNANAFIQLQVSQETVFMSSYVYIYQLTWNLMFCSLPYYVLL